MQTASSMARRRKGPPCSLLLLLGTTTLLCFLAAAAAAAAAAPAAPARAAAAATQTTSSCPLRFDIDPATTLSISGQSAYSKVAQGKTSFPVTHRPAVPLTLQGALWGGLTPPSSPPSACPPAGDADAWRDALPRLRLASGPSAYAFEPVRLSPSNLYLSVFGVPLNITGLEFNLTLSGGASAAGGAAAASGRPPDGALSVSATQLGAYVFSNTSFTGGAQLTSMGGQTYEGFTRPVRLELDDGSAKTSKTNQTAAAAAADDESNVDLLPSIVLTIPGFNLTFASNTSGQNVANDGFGTLRTTLNGTLVLRAPLPSACPPGGCGAYGRCVAGAGGGPSANGTANSTTTTAAAKCECQCGWALSPQTGRCEVPGGAVCPLYPSGFGGAFGASAAKTIGGGGGGGGACAGAGGAGGDDSAAALALRGACPQGYGFATANKACERCPPGFGGADCATCSGDAACRSLPGAPPSSTCSTGVAYDVRSSRKQYTCSVVPEDIVKVVGPTLSFYCDTGASSSSPSGAAATGAASGGGGTAAGGKGASAASVDASALARAAGAFCHISLRLGDMPAGQLAVCRATGCHFAAGRSSWVCDSVACGCPTGCSADGQDFASTFEGISGKATLDCEADGGLGGAGGGGGGGASPAPKQTGLAAALGGGAASAGKCSLGVGSLNVRLDLDCQAAECLDPDGPALLGSELPSQRDIGAALAPALAAVPAAALLIGAGVCAALAVGVLPFVRATKPGGGGAGAGDGSAVPADSKGGKMSSAGPVAEAVEEEEEEGGRDAAAAAGGGGGGAAPLTGGAASSSAAATSIAPAPFLRGRGHAQQLLDEEGGAARPSLRELRWDDVDVWVRGKAAAALAAAAAASSAPAPPAAPAGANKGRGSLFGGNRFAVARKATAASTHSMADTEAGVLDTNNNNNVMNGNNEEDDDDAWHRHSPPPTGAGWRHVLRGVSGALHAGEMTGVMGPSGCGKSTLLHVLTGALAGGGAGGNHWRVRGRVAADGQRVGPGRLARLTALVPQDDLLVRSLTVEESLYYSAALRLDARMSPAACRARVDGVLSDLGLDKVRRSTVLSGATGATGVSGGERRRVAIGMELLTRPGCLVLDEPCSGLDAFTAVQLMRTLRRVATEGRRALALSLHQPSPVMYALLDRAVLVAGGRIVYSGPPQGAAAALADLGAPCPEGVPLAEHLLFAVSDPSTAGGVVGRAAERADAERAARRQRRRGGGGNGDEGGGGGALALSNGGGMALIASVPSSVQQQQEQQQQEQQQQQQEQQEQQQQQQHQQQEQQHQQTTQKRSLEEIRPGAARQLGVLFWRSLLDVLRNPLLAGLHAAGGLLLGVVVGAIFLRVSNDTSGAQNRVGAMFFALCLLAFTSVTTVDLVQAERAAAAREVQRRYYSSGLYCLAKLLVDGLALRALPAVLFCVPFYFLMGLVPLPAQFFTFVFVVVAFSCAVGALALALSALLDSPGKAALLMNMVLLVGVLFAGFLANKSAIPPALRWITYFSVFRYAWEALVINEMKALWLYFSAPGIDITVTVKGDAFLEIIGVDARMLVPDVAVLVAIWMLCVLFAFFAVWWRYGRRADVSGDRKERRRERKQQKRQQQQQAAAALAATALPRALAA